MHVGLFRGSDQPDRHLVDKALKLRILVGAVVCYENALMLTLVWNRALLFLRLLGRLRQRRSGRALREQRGAAAR